MVDALGHRGPDGRGLVACSPEVHFGHTRLAILDLSPRGIPQEPVGFSGNPSLFGGKPKPSDSLFEHGTTDSVISVRLIPPRKKKERLAPVAPRTGDR